MGASNTVVLLFSSLTAALAVRSAQLGKRNQTSIYLVVTILCAFVFLVVKYFEYSHKFHLGLLPGHCFGHPGFSAAIQNGQEVGTCLRIHADAAPVMPQWVRAVDEEGHVQLLPPRANMFFGLYFVMTGLHGLHVIIGMSILIWVLVKNMQGQVLPGVLHAGRPRRALLAPRRPRVDLPLPAPLPRRKAGVTMSADRTTHTRTPSRRRRRVHVAHREHSRSTGHLRSAGLP